MVKRSRKNRGMLATGGPIGEAVPIEQASDGGCVQTSAVGAPDLARLRHDDRATARRADDRTKTVAFAIVHDGADRQSELSGLAAEFVVTPAAMGRKPRNADPLQQFPWRKRVLERAGDEVFDRKPPRTAGARDHALSAERAEGRNPVRG